MDYWCKSRTTNLTPKLSSFRCVRRFKLEHASQKPLQIMLRYNDLGVKSGKAISMEALEIGFSSRKAAYMSYWVPLGSWLD